MIAPPSSGSILMTSRRAASSSGALTPKLLVPMPMTGSFSFVDGTVFVMSGRLLSAAPASPARPTANPTVAYTPDLMSVRREKLEPSEADMTCLRSIHDEVGRDGLNPARLQLSSRGGHWAGVTAALRIPMT